MSTGALLEIQAVGMTYGQGDRQVVALEGIDLTVQEGEFLCLVGESGCGKTTLLRIIAGLEEGFSGAVQVDGVPVTKPGRDRGVVFQEHRLFPWLTVEENVAFALPEGRKDPQGVREHLALVGLESFARAYPRQLSGGMAQRAAIARALVNRPRILLLDEPFGALDALTRRRMQEEILRIWKQEKVTMVMVTHDMEEALYLGDRVAVLSSRPGTIRELTEVPLPRPRERETVEFQQLRRHLEGQLLAE